MAGFALANIVGLFRGILIANAFGTSAVLDAYYAAEKLPNILFVLVAGGALASAFIPNFTEFLERDDQKGAWHLAASITNLIILILILLSIFAAVFAPMLVSTIIAPDFDIAQQALTVELLRIMLFTSAIFGVSGLVMGILNAHQSFLLPALAPTMLWVGIILGVLFFVPSMGVHGLAWGTVLGAGLHLIVQLPAVLRLPNFYYRPQLGLKTPAVRKVGLLMAPRLLGVAVVQINFLVNINLASGMSEGSLTAITIAFMVMTMPQVVIAQAISVAALPTFAAQVARGELGEMRASLANTLRSIIFLSLPAMLGLILLRQPVISMLFERGEFDANSVSLTTWALLWYTLGLVSHSLVEILSRAFYALHDTKTPVFVGTIVMGLNIAFSLLFAYWFRQLGWMPHGGLALANTLATTLEMFALLWLMRKRLNGLQGGHVLKGTLQAGLAAATMSVTLFWWLNAFSAISVWWLALGGVTIGGAVYALLMIAQPVPEVRGLLRWGLGKIRR